MQRAHPLELEYRWPSQLSAQKKNCEVRADRNRGIVARPGKFSAFLHGAGGRQCVGTADPPAFMRYARSVLISPIFDLNPLERARTELKLAPGFLVRSAPKPRRVVDRVGA
jgi:hypothetical protein